MVVPRFLYSLGFEKTVRYGVLTIKYNLKYEGRVMKMTVALTQSDFRAHLKEYLDRVNDDDETIYIARSNSCSVAVIS